MRQTDKQRDRQMYVVRRKDDYDGCHLLYYVKTKISVFVRTDSVAAKDAQRTKFTVRVRERQEEKL